MVIAIRKYTIDDILARLQGVKKNGSGYMACCPAHEDKNPSLSVCEKSGKILIKCFAGCSYETIMSALDMPVNDAMPKTAKPSKREIKQTYDYTDRSGQLIFQVVRFEPKSFSQRHPGGKTGWLWNMKDIEPVIYHLPEVLEAVKTGQTIWITEGEKDTDNARAMGLVATTSPMGAGKWRDNYTNDLLGASQVVVIADKDAPGRKHASDIAMSCRRQRIPVKIIEVPAQCQGFYRVAGSRRPDIRAG
jgi:DNA primase (bacterial type)